MFAWVSLPALPRSSALALIVEIERGGGPEFIRVAVLF